MQGKKKHHKNHSSATRGLYLSLVEYDLHLINPDKMPIEQLTFSMINMK